MTTGDDDAEGEAIRRAAAGDVVMMCGNAQKNNGDDAAMAW